MIMTECRFHQEYDTLTSGIRTLRCAHYGERYVHERINQEIGYRWFNLVWESQPIRKPLLVHVGPDGDDVMWDILVMDMMDDNA